MLRSFKTLFTGVRGKFLLISTLSIVICAMAVFFVSLEEHEQIYLDSVEDNIEALSANVADDLLLYLVDQPDSFELKNQLLIFERYDHIISATIYDEEWQVIERYISPKLNPVLLKEYMSSKETTPKELSIGVSRIEDHLVAVYPIGDAVDPIGFLQVVHDFKTPIVKSRDALFVTTMPLVILVLLISLSLTWYLFQHLFSPLIDLSEFTRLIGRTRDYTLRFKTKGNDEVSNLSRDVNSMLETINKENKLNKEQNAILRTQQDSMYQLANFDQLTDLPNRRNIIEFLDLHLETAKVQGNEVAILYFDVDSFKAVNDRLGHETGDKLLIKISEEVKSCMRPNDILARLAGDEFLVVLIDEIDVSLAGTIADRIIEQFKAPVKVGKWEIHTGVSIGISLGSQANYNVDSLISNADIAMYVSKNQGRGLSTVFDPKMLHENSRKLQIVNLIPQALENEEFSLRYQPKVSSAGNINSVEALIRWESPDLGFISPGEFIPIAESGGRIGDITHWVISNVAQDLNQILEICGADTVVSLNISSKDLLIPNLEQHILSSLQLNGQSIRSLQFEITESSFLEEFDIANDFFSRIRSLGGSIALDDFGTGYSSLSYLTRIEIDTLKIDRQFVFNALNSEKDAMVLNSIIELSNKMDLFSCCEGIETAEHAIYLIDLGCNSLQGYYFAHPVTIDQLDHAVSAAKMNYRDLYPIESHIHSVS
ncbi:EAL domain-containing protein [Vibrio sp. RC27]